MATVNAPSLEDIKAGFTYQRFTPVIGEPTYNSIAQLETEAIRNVATVECRMAPPHHNLCGMIEQPANYQLRVGAAFLNTPYPRDAPTYPACCTAAQKRVTIFICYNMMERNFSIFEAF